jgi:small subunit ribosomal protein S2
VKKSIDRLLALEHARDEGRFEFLTKKEALELNREIIKMDKNLGGIKNMKGLPSVIFVVDPRKEHLAIREATTLGIPVVALCDTNCDPDGIEYVIPGNDDALKSIRLFTTAIADSVVEGAQRSSEVSAADYQGPSNDEAAAVEIIRRPTGDAEVEAAAADAPETAPAVEAEAAEAPTAEA